MKTWCAVRSPTFPPPSPIGQEKRPASIWKAYGYCLGLGQRADFIEKPIARLMRAFHEMIDVWTGRPHGSLVSIEEMDGRTISVYWQ